MNPLLHRGKLLIVTMALAFGGLAASAAAVQAAQAATHPAAANLAMKAIPAAKPVIPPGSGVTLAAKPILPSGQGMAALTDPPDPC